ncbi:hypothetical protein DSM110093_03858 (plasmid) [Sulfitobacter sp. DSM 110093]|uniref:Uncharacterized protein n=1 Tax=Sulfitobacter dubius TaxID=218673 RepID=A0ABY3ZPD4_9RHOB|nr:hypothetical protein DSM109990_03401 [Sulfitobacter dubius]UOA33762.1 hypothetical protein DSM110093_03597 [Sulfitobacter sp. DSM 110093]UOA34023.1 hypothetical protein DSM110093_03858 [Sulfitobacter sp. DSM 110093]
MIRTVLISKYIHIQGQFVRALSCGNIVVSVGNKEFEGRPLSALPKSSSHEMLAVS